jgi:hypothetical protein
MSETSRELLRGASAIAKRLGITPAMALHLDRQRRLPIFRVNGCPCATPAALDDWRALVAAGILPPIR